MIKRIMLKDGTIAKMIEWDGSGKSLKAIKELLPNVTVKRDYEFPDKQINLYFGYRTEEVCTFTFNHIVLYPNGKVDIVDINWLNENVYLYDNIFSVKNVKKKYVYFVSGFMTKNGEDGYTNHEVGMETKITRSEQILEIQDTIRKDNGYDDFIISNFQLLRIEEE